MEFQGRAYCIRQLEVLSAEVVEVDHILLNAEAIQEVENGLRHHGRTTEVVLTILGRLVLLEVGVAHNGCYEACGILDTCCIGLGIGTVQRKVEVEVVELLLQCEEVVEEWDLLLCACTVEVVHLTVAALTGLEHVHDLCTERSHTGTTTYPNHLTA